MNMTVEEYLKIRFGDFLQEQLRNKSLTDIYQSTPNTFYPLSCFIDMLWRDLMEAEKSDSWIECNEKAPSREIVRNELSGLTKIKPSHMAVWSKKYGFTEK